VPVEPATAAPVATAPVITLEQRQPDPAEALEPDTTRITSPPLELDGCRWMQTERLLEGSRDVRCGEQTLPNRPFCSEHERRYRQGRSLIGRGLLSPMARD
jgi:hypothetical protein